MKRILAILTLVIIVASMFAVGVNAAGAINANEQKILDKLSETYKVNSKTYSIPKNYVNQAKNYFLTIDMTEAQAKEILGYLNEGEALVKKEEAKLTTNVVNFDTFKYSIKKEILELGKKACKVVDLTLTYDGTYVKIVEDKTGKVAFIDEPIIKVTGANVTVTAAIAVSVMVLVSFGAMIIISKKVTAR